MASKEPDDDGSILKKLSARFFRLNIANKLLLGYLPLPIIIILISLFALSSLKRLNNINESVLDTDYPVIEASDKMIDNLLAQELYGRRYAILKSSDMLVLFWKRSEEFNQIAEQIALLPGRKKFPMDSLISLHNEYNTVLMQGVEYLAKPASSRAKEYEGRIKKKQEELIRLIKKMSSDARHDQNEKALMTSKIATTAFRVTALLCIAGLLLGLGSTILITGNISGSINQLKLATKDISEGRFDYTYNIQNKDELGELSNSFSEMARRLKRLEEMYLDANPLTRLPGGIAIENVLQKRLSAGAPLAFCLIDMDNFKAFNDRYGYANGSEVIKATAVIIEEAAAKNGTVGDFVGHIGGDDFVLITTPERYVNICNAVIETFDKTIPSFYDPEDRNRGYITGKTRQGQEVPFPLMTISIAVVTNNERSFKSVAEIGAVAAELKEYAKSIKGSIYVVDKRRKALQRPDEAGAAAMPSGETVGKA